MFIQDYIMRLITQMIRALLDLLFDIETDSPTADLIEDYNARNHLITLTDMIDNGEINDAENKLYEALSYDDMQDLKLGLLFYSHLNEKDDAFLSAHNYGRDEIELGVRTLAEKYNVSDVLALFNQN